MRLAIILPAGARDGALRQAQSLALLHAGQDWPGIGRTEVVLALADAAEAEIAALRPWCRDAPGRITLRRFVWRAMAAEAAQALLPPGSAPPGPAPILLPDDAGRELRDADAWLFLASNTHGRIPWLRPTSVWRLDPLPRRGGAGAPHDDHTASRLVAAMTGWRRARCVLAATQALREDLITYAGIHPDRALIAPLPDAAAPPSPAVIEAHAGILRRLAADA